MNKKIQNIVKDQYFLFTIKYFWLFRIDHLSKLKKYLLRIYFDVDKLNSDRKSIPPKIQKRISNLFSKNNVPELNSIYLEKIKGINNQIIFKENLSDDFIIRLATQEEGLKDIDFNKQYPDLEDYFALNRFIWLNQVLLEMPNLVLIKICRDLIENWIRYNKKITNDPKFESYSISERIISWIFFLRFIKDYSYDLNINYKIIAESIELQTKHLIKNLEYNGDLTNNHILNNARAIYIVGKVFENNNICQLGQDIFQSEVNNIIKDGVLQEGSSHYQILLTKSLIETCLIADLYNDEQFKNFLQIIIVQMLMVCNDLFSNNSSDTFPIFGDISPDVSPKWFLGFPFNNNSLQSKWYKLFNYIPGKIKNINQDYKKLDLNVESLNWRKIINSDLEVWINLRSGNNPCHSHNDNGTIVIYYKGNPVIIDLGLYSYTNSEFCKQQKSEFAHNMPVINGFGVDVSSDSIVYNYNLFSHITYYKESKNKITYVIAYANNIIKVKRVITVHQNFCSIKDQIIRGKKKNIYEVNWHFNGKCEKTDQMKYQVNGIPMYLKTNSRIKPKTLNTFYSSNEYGHRQSISSLNIRSEIKLRDSFISEFHFLNG